MRTFRFQIEQLIPRYYPEVSIAAVLEERLRDGGENCGQGIRGRKERMRTRTKELSFPTICEKIQILPPERGVKMREGENFFLSFVMLFVFGGSAEGTRRRGRLREGK